MGRKSVTSLGYYLILANKAFGFSPDYTMWKMSWQSLSILFIELNCYNDEQNGDMDKSDNISSLSGIAGVVIKD